MNPTDVHECRRCGTCCRKGGPALHRQDRDLVECGAIPAAGLYTLRKGELAWDPIRTRLLPLQDEIIKVKSTADTDACRFLVSEENRCEIYAERPQECRILTCWDIRAIEAFYQRDRLTRRELLGNIGHLWDLIQTHEAHCSIARLARWARQWHGGERRKSIDRLADIIRFDMRLRKTIVNGGGDPDLLDFLFGRPLTELFENQFGIRVCSSADKRFLMDEQ